MTAPIANPMIQVRVSARSVGATFATTTYTVESYQEMEKRSWTGVKPDRQFPDAAAVLQAAPVGAIGFAVFTGQTPTFWLPGEKYVTAVCP